ncbi:VirB3 family type IV secretion system protein [Erwinia amylovora]|uniref:VirB4 family type IV secretion/conjugal transfer ATPase n=1 Tax=Erwinia amylovora TaxID=552 RepID=UPI0014442461|nr:VirB3 family type IV secretion system protein [Erwinia amylovora]
MTILNKALTRPAAIKGIPLVPLVIAYGGITLIAVYINYWLLLLLIPATIEMKNKCRKDIFYFHNKLLEFRTRGRRAFNKFFNSNVITANKYDSIDIKEFIESMRLNESINISKYIPYSSHIHAHVIKNKNGDLVSTWELGGTIFECEDEDHINLMTMQINNLTRSFEGLPFTFYIHRIREDYTDTFQSNSGIDFSDEVSAMYYDTIDNKPFRRDLLFFSACYVPLSRVEKTALKQKASGARKNAYDAALKSMLEYWDQLNTSLSRFSAKALGAYEDKGRVYSSQLSFYNRLITGFWQPVAVTRTPFYDVLCNADLFFSTDTAQSNSLDKKRFFRSLEIKDHAPKTYSGLFDALLYSKCNYVLTQSYTCMAKDEAHDHIKLAEKRMRSTEDDAISQREDLIVARDLLQSGHIGFGKYHFSLIVESDDAEQVVKDTNTLAEPLKDLGILTTLSTLSLPAAFMAQMPGVYGLRPRLVPVSSQNFAEMASLHNFHPHKRDGNPWGEAIAILKTPSGGNHYLNLHNSQVGVDEFNEKNPGNTMILGSTGTGKSTLLAMMKHLMQKYRKPESFAPGAGIKRFTTVYFDKDRSAEMSIRQMGGRYYRIRTGEPTGWNPFSLAPTKRNINFIKQIIRIICTRDGQQLDPRDKERISAAVDRIMLDYPPEYRRFGITRLLEVLPEPPTKEARTNGLRIRLKQWAQGGEFGWVFDNEEDTFDISDIDNFGIDGTEFLDNKDVCGPITYYLLYRVTSLLDGRRLVLFMDEFWKWLLDAEFANFALNMLKVIRKLNGIFVPATQSPEEMVKHEISAAIIEQCGTQIFMANSKAKQSDYVDKLKVPQSVFEIVKELDPGARQMVILKTPLRRGETRPFIALTTLDLSGLGKYTKLLSGSQDNLVIFDSLYKEGMKPEEWKNKFLDNCI